MGRLRDFRRTLFYDPLFWKSLWVTSSTPRSAVPIAMTRAFALALLLNTGTPGQRIFRTLFYLPSIMPTIAVSVLWLWILNPDLGLLNALLEQIGLPHVQWLTSETLVCLETSTEFVYLRKFALNDRLLRVKVFIISCKNAHCLAGGFATI